MEKKQGLGKCGPSVKIYTFLYNNHFLSAWPVDAVNYGGNWM